MQTTTTTKTSTTWATIRELDALLAHLYAAGLDGVNPSKTLLRRVRVLREMIGRGE